MLIFKKATFKKVVFFIVKIKKCLCDKITKEKEILDKGSGTCSQLKVKSYFWLCDKITKEIKGVEIKT
jgi:hypothetical protein